MENITAQKKIILLVEDEISLIDIYQIYFELNGYTILSAKNIEDALVVTKLKKPDLILLDIIFPREENGVINFFAEQGFEFLKIIKDDPTTKIIPVIVLTNLNQPADRQKCAELGASAYIFKGLATPKEVLETVRKVMQKK